LTETLKLYEEIADVCMMPWNPNPRHELVPMLAMASEPKPRRKAGA
jgi:hypothetical protein